VQNFFSENSSGALAGEGAANSSWLPLASLTRVWANFLESIRRHDVVSKTIINLDMTWQTLAPILVLILSCHGDISAQQKVRALTESKTPLGVRSIDGVFDQENLNSLSLDKKLASARPLLGEKDEYPEFTRELIQVQWRAGDPIDLYVIKPRGAIKPPVILYLYGYPSDTDRFRNNTFCQTATANGYAAVGFVSALTGQRYHDRPMREWFVSQLHNSLTESVHDVQMILDYLAMRGDLDIDHVGMFSQGSGATVAILAASVEPRIRALDALQPWGAWPTWMATSSLIPDAERADYVKPDFLASIAPLDPVNQLGHLSTRIRVQFVEDDSITPVAAVKQIAQDAASRDQVVEYPTSLAQYNVLSGGRAFDWIKLQLRVPEAHSENTMGAVVPATP
jgi:dienelactone hydrolase